MVNPTACGVCWVIFDLQVTIQCRRRLEALNDRVFIRSREDREGNVSDLREYGYTGGNRG